MTETIDEIQRRFLSIDSSTFERLCGKFLYYHNEIPSLPVSSGKASMKNRPRKGIPDAYCIDGTRYHLIVCTAQDGRNSRAKLIRKIKGDIESALSQANTKIPLENVATIFVCLADSLLVHEDLDIKNTFSEYSSLIKIWNGNQMADYIARHYAELAKDYLGLVISRKTILGLNEYLDKTGTLAESFLVNPFMPPDNYENYNSVFRTNKIIIISGPSGTGKTRLAVELLKDYVRVKSGNNAFCIRSNAAPNPEYIETSLIPGQNVLLIDDAGRETTNLIRVLDRWNANDRYIEKLVLTTRDYALKALEEELSERNIKYDKIIIEKSSNRFIEQVLDKQEIKNETAIDKIVSISKGRVRLAIMGAQLFNDGKEEFDAEGIYEHFFEKIAKDKTELNSELAQKLLALIYFFKFIDFEDFKSIETTLTRFGINEKEAKRVLFELKECEFVDGMENIFRVGDQEIGFYHFFKVFIKESILPLQTLLTPEKLKYTHQLKETIGECFKIFEKSTSLTRVRSLLELTYEQLQDVNLRIDFLTVFCSEFPDLSYDLAKEIVFSFPKPTSCFIFVVQELTEKKVVWGRPKVVQFIRLNFSERPESIAIYFELLMELVRRKSELFSEFIHIIFYDLEPKKEDRLNGYIRQYAIFRALEKHSKNGDSLAIATICSISHKWLTSDSLEASLSKRKDNAIYYYPDTNYIPVRNLIWELLTNQFGKGIQPYRLLRDFANNVEKSLYRLSDSPILQELITKNLSQANLSDRILVNDLAKMNTCSENKEIWEKVNCLFLNNDVLIAEKLGLRVYYRHKQNRELSHHENCELLFNEIAPFIEGEYRADSFIRVYEIATVLFSNKNGHSDSYFIYLRLDGLLNAVLHYSASEYIKCIEYLVESTNPIGFVFNQTSISNFFKIDSNQAWSLYTILTKSFYQTRDYALLSFFSSIPDTVLNENYAKELCYFIETRTERLCLNISELDRYRKYIPDLYENIICVSVKKYLAGENPICIRFNDDLFFFDQLIDANPTMAESFFSMQISIDYFRANNNKMLSRLLLKRKSYLNEIFLGKKLYTKYNYHDNLGDFLFNGTIPNSIEIVHDLISDFIEKPLETDHFIRLIFGNVCASTAEYDNALSYVREYAISNAHDYDKSRLSIRILAEQFSEHLIDIIADMLFNGLDPKLLERIDLLHSILRSGHEITSEIRKEQYKAIYSALSRTALKNQNPLQYGSCASVLNKLIRSSEKSSRDERRRMFKGHIW